ncbi:hypothetical protein RFF05_13400 [Bengtsoniella intestinalis]|uniref:hypothetical protein n=1 Tax=Bengtsoniella intestinalis TaxID=3073143 RepID=UPI00391F15C5
MEEQRNDNQVLISQEEYDELKAAKEAADAPKTSTHNIYDRVNVPIKVLDYVIILGTLGIAVAIVIGILL